jgi:hypothetical protein
VQNRAKKEWTASKSVDCFKMDGLFCLIGQTPAKNELYVKKSQSSVLGHVLSQFESASPVLNLAKKEWTA